jgi:hypothetical protein
MDPISRRKPRKYKGLHPQPTKTSRRELTVVERAFVAGACIAGSLSHNDCAKLMHPRCNKSTITRTCQRVNRMAEQLSCSVSDPRCFENPTNRGAERKLTDAQEAMVVDLVTSNRQHREQETWQLIQSGELEAIGLPKISISLLETIMYGLDTVGAVQGGSHPSHQLKRTDTNGQCYTTLIATIKGTT